MSTSSTAKTPEIIKQDEDCKKIINTKCYYQILNIDKSANQEEIRKAYKKVTFSFLIS